MTDLLTIAEAQIAEKQFKEIEAIKQRLEQDKELLKQAIELVNSHTLYKKVDVTYGRCGRYKYVLATEEMLKQDYIGEPKPYCFKGIKFHQDTWTERTNKGIMEVNGHAYYDIRYALNNYEAQVKKKEDELLSLNRRIRELKDDLELMYENFPTLKQAITEWQEWEKKQNDM